MSKLNAKKGQHTLWATTKAKKAPTNPITTATAPTARTHEGGLGYVRDVKSELFLLAVSHFVKEDKFYESADNRDARFVRLIAQNAVEDPLWTANMLRWLRTGAHMRTASIIGAVEAAKARLDAREIPPHVRVERRPYWYASIQDEHAGINRAMVRDALKRPDEPGAALDYYHETYGKQVPMPIKKGIADAARRMYHEWSVLKYDTDSHAVRFGDILELTHPKPGGQRHSDLYRHTLNRRHGRTSDEYLNGALPLMAKNAELRARVAGGEPELLYDATVVKDAGMTWEDQLSLGGQYGLDKRKLWEAIIPSMNYMALLRNLRNFDAAGVPDVVTNQVAAKLVSAPEVAMSKQFPFRFLSAYNATKGSLRWGHVLSQALDASLINVPKLPGRTLVLIDTSGSMTWTDSENSRNNAKMAALFGIALARRAEHADVYSFSGTTKKFPLRAGEALLVAVERFHKDYFLNSGTETAQAVRATFAGHDRIVIVTDEQAFYDGFPKPYRPYERYYADAGPLDTTVPASVPIYTWNIDGNEVGHLPGDKRRYTFGGLTDAGFQAMAMIEAGQDGRWPWETEPENEFGGHGMGNA